ncbi:response regulator [Thermodesulfobacteriota bacterium]
MENLNILKGKKVLIVDDEPDVLETLTELLDMCIIDSAQNFEDAKELLNKNIYDVLIFDIMGVKGYDLLEIAKQKGRPALMLTAHALSPDDLVKSIEGSARAYIPKEKMPEIATYVADLLKDHQEGKKHRRWFSRLKAFFDRQFGTEWIEQHKEFWDKYYWLYPDE